MINVAQLNSWLGKSMKDICLNGFDSTSKNHCAHFVSHVLNLHFGYTCKSHTGGKQSGANLRVHEIFSHCGSTAEVRECSTTASGIIFVSGKKNFVTTGGTTILRNIPRKHVGILIGNSVWHYSNTNNKVVKQQMSQFLNHYRGQENALWLGSLPTGSRAIWYGQC